MEATVAEEVDILRKNMLNKWMQQVKRWRREEECILCATLQFYAQ
jgi:hypothetical protein